MAKKNKDGSWEWTADEEQEIAMGEEVRVRAMRRDRQERAAEAQAEKCAAGDHKAPVEGKCPACGAAHVAKPAREGNKRIRVI